MRAINASVMRQVNRKLILNQIRLRPISRAELAEITQLTRASVTQIIDELIAEGTVVETAMIGRTRLGRRSTQLAIARDARVFFGVNLTRTQCIVGAVNMVGEVLRHNTEIVVGRHPLDVLDSVAAIIRRHKIDLNLTDDRIACVGLCVPGPVDVENGRMMDPAGFEVWHGLPVTQLLAERIHLPVALQSATTSLALDVKYFSGYEDSFALIRVDEGVCASVVDGDSGRVFEADFGRFAVDAEDPSDRLDQFISMPRLLMGTGCRTWTELMDRGGDAKCEAAIEQLEQYLSMGIANLVCAFRIRRVVLTGELCYHGELWLEEMKHAVRRRAGADVDIILAPAVNPVRTASSPAYDHYFQVGAWAELIPNNGRV